MLISRISVVILFASMRLMAWAQDVTSADSTQTLSVYGSVDTYFHRSFDKVEQAPRTSFSNLPGFSLGMVNLVMDYSTTRSGFVTDLVFGPRGSDAIFNAPSYRNIAGSGSAQMINQMFVYYQWNSHIKLNIGQFNTFFGYELISPVKNPQYSTSYSFSYGPFNHTGAWADFKLSSNVSAKVALMNPTDYTEFNPFDSYTIGSQLSVSGNHSIVNLNVSWGDPDGKLTGDDSIGSTSAGNALQAELVGTLQLSKRYTVGFSGTLRSIGPGRLKANGTDQDILKRNGYRGATVYQCIAVSPRFSLALRSEYFYEYNHGVNAIGSYTDKGNASVFALTMSGGLKLSALRVVPEIRYDRTDTSSFTDAATGDRVGDMMSFNFAVIYALPAIFFKGK
jgi:hypothetical protein